MAPLCAFRAEGDADGQEFAPCLEGIRFAQSMREQGFSDYADYYTPGVAADTCARKTAGQPLSSQGATGSDVRVQLAYRQAEIAARCPSTTAPTPRRRSRGVVGVAQGEERRASPAYSARVDAVQTAAYERAEVAWDEAALHPDRHRGTAVLAGSRPTWRSRGDGCARTIGPSSEYRVDFGPVAALSSVSR